MPAALRSVPPTRSPEREALRIAIQDHAVAKQRLAKLEDVMERASSNRLNLSSGVDQGRAALREAEANEGSYLAAVALNETDGSDSPVKAARERLAQTEADYAQAKKTAEALEKEAVTAVQALDWATIQLNNAVKGVVKTDPVMQQLVDGYKSAQKIYLDHCKLLSLLSDLGCTLLPSWGEGYSPQHNSVSQGPAPSAPAWQAAIERLRTDADASLPS